jgi:hypothetical protein
MALSYDYYNCVQALLAAGADPSIKNNADHEARKGIDGETSFAMAALLTAESTADASEALKMCEEAGAEIDKAEFVSRGMKAKKKLGSAWTSELQDKFKQILSKLP